MEFFFSSDWHQLPFVLHCTQIRQRASNTLHRLRGANAVSNEKKHNAKVCIVHRSICDVLVNVVCQQSSRQISVLLDDQSQLVVLRKWAAAELRTPMTDISIVHYALCYWRVLEEASGLLMAFQILTYNLPAHSSHTTT